MEDATNIVLPFQYGYGSHYIDMAGKKLNEMEYTSLEQYSNGGRQPLWQYCQNNNIILRSNIQTGCKKRELSY